MGGQKIQRQYTEIEKGLQRLPPNAEAYIITRRFNKDL